MTDDAEVMAPEEAFPPAADARLTSDGLARHRAASDFDERHADAARRDGSSAGAILDAAPTRDSLAMVPGDDADGEAPQAILMTISFTLIESYWARVNAPASPPAGEMISMPALLRLQPLRGGGAPREAPICASSQLRLLGASLAAMTFDEHASKQAADTRGGEMRR